MKSFVKGFLLAIFLLFITKEFVKYKSLQFTDKNCGFKNEQFSCDDSKYSLAQSIESHFINSAYFGIPLTGRCESQESIEYFGCSHLQIWLDNTFHRGCKK